MRTALALMLLLVLVLAMACGKSPSDPTSYSKVYESNGYRIYYQSPPWKGPRDVSGGEAWFVSSNAEAFFGVDVDASIVPPKYSLLVTQVAGTAMALAASQEAASIRAGEQVVQPARDITTRQGIRGRELLTFVEVSAVGRYRRYVFLSQPGGGVLRMAFESSADVGEREVTEMIRLVEFFTP